MLIDNKYELGDKVYLITDKEQSMRLITAMKICPSGIMYELSLGPNISMHYDFEVSLEENIIFKTK